MAAGGESMKGHAPYKAIASVRVAARPVTQTPTSDRRGCDTTYAVPRTADSILATSIFCISIIAPKARLATSPPLAIASVSTRGVICQDNPHLSLHQPHALSTPPLPTIAFQ